MAVPKGEARFRPGDIVRFPTGGGDGWFWTVLYWDEFWEQYKLSTRFANGGVKHIWAHHGEFEMYKAWIALVELKPVSDA